jgi:hypothetical protein
MSFQTCTFFIQNLLYLNACDGNTEDDHIDKNSADVVVNVVEW